jgi:hypothetical protein
VIAVVAVRLKVGPLARSGQADHELFAGRPQSAAEHIAAADAHAAAGAWAEAVRERLRAVVRSLEERGLLDPRPGRTADEVAWEAGAVLPHCASDLRAAVRVFDDVWYGGRQATQEHDLQLRALTAKVASARPVTTSTVGPS